MKLTITRSYDHNQPENSYPDRYPVFSLVADGKVISSTRDYTDMRDAGLVTGIVRSSCYWKP